MQRQLSKMALATEQARTMVYQTAQALAAADQDSSKRPLMRINGAFGICSGGEVLEKSGRSTCETIECWLGGGGCAKPPFFLPFMPIRFLDALFLHVHSLQQRLLRLRS